MLSKFESDYETNEQIITVLLKDKCNGAIVFEKEYLSKPVIIESEFGDFVLNRSMSWFESKVYLDESTLNVYLETDKDNDDTANNAIETFISIANNFNEFDMKNKEAAANFLLELANDWLADYDSENKPEEITKQMFMDAIEISEVTISPDGSMTVYYDDGNLFWGHVIEMYIESDGSCSDAHIAG